MQTQKMLARPLVTRYWRLLAVSVGLILLAITILLVSRATIHHESARQVLPQAVTAVDLLALKEARAEALEPVETRALPQPVTAGELLALKEARAEALEPVETRALPRPVTAADLLALKEARAETR